MGRHQALPTLGQDRWLSALRRTVQSWKGRTLSPTARLLVLVGVIAGAVVMTIMVAAVFISRGAGAEPSTNVALTGTPTPSHSPTPKATPTPSKRETITPMVTPTVTPTITRANGHPTVAFYSTDRWNDGF
ncbi:MAG TPA: hypothetical protein VE287_05990, partial [Actinopolymorphaceae bacterium]|nr:hypothetical protein [Actinopolymorphaceae bacterium]